MIFTKRNNDCKKIFLISTGRTGTKFFATYFNQHKPFWGYHIYHEPQPNMEGFCFDYHKKIYTEEKAEEIFLENRDTLIKNAKQLYFESNGNFGFLFPLLRNLYKDSYFILIIRDPITYTRSVANRVLKTDSGNIQKYSIDKYWLLKSNMLPKDKYYGKWSEFDMYEKTAWTWRFRNSTYLNYVENDEKSMVVRFEDVFLDPNKPGIDQMNDFLKNTVKTRLKIKKADPLFNKKVNTNARQIDTAFGSEYIKNSKYYKELVSDLTEKFGYTLP